MAEKKQQMYKKMYKSSPEMKRDEESGDMKVSRAEKESARTNDGTEGMAITEQGPMYDRHMKEVSDMHDRHLAERKDMVKRHMKEMKSAAPEEAQSGEEEIQKTTDKE